MIMMTFSIAIFFDEKNFTHTDLKFSVVVDHNSWEVLLPLKGFDGATTKKGPLIFFEALPKGSFPTAKRMNFRKIILRIFHKAVQP